MSSTLQFDKHDSDGSQMLAIPSSPGSSISLFTPLINSSFCLNLKVV